MLYPGSRTLINNQLNLSVSVTHTLTTGCPGHLLPLILLPNPSLGLFALRSEWVRHSYIFITAALHHLCDFLTRQQYFTHLSIDSGWHSIAYEVTHYTDLNLHILVFLFISIRCSCFLYFCPFGFELNDTDTGDAESKHCNILNASAAVILLMQRASWKIPHLQSSLLNPTFFAFHSICFSQA